MAAAYEPISVAVAGGVPLTKFRAPRVRADTVARPGLLDRLARAAGNCPVTLVCAPAGAGKTTLLSQWAAAAGPATTVVWITLDAEDDDANRLYAALVQAVEALGLAWEIDPRRLAAGVSGGGTQARAAIGALVNALCTSPAQRIVIVLDDLHRVESRDALALLEAFVERLPEHVALLLGTRVEPRLPLARWRAYGELADFGPHELRFDIDAALALAEARLGCRLPERELRAALERTHGWAAGLGMWLQSRHRGEAQPLARGGADAANRRLFAYLAQEILDELPEDLRDFVLRVSILAELSPEPCRLLTGRADAAAVLEDLYRRNLFLSALDELTPVLRFHDLFRDFLRAELLRRLPGEVRGLHERAATAPLAPGSIVHHLLRAERWDEAIGRILALGEPLLMQGAVGTLERWIDGIPPGIRAAHPPLAYLRGTCAWLRWDWTRARAELATAVDGMTAPPLLPLRTRAAFQLVDALSSSGDVDGAIARLDEVARLPLGPVQQVEWLLHRAWCTLPNGPLDEVARLLREFVVGVERDPATLCPATAPRIHTLMIGLPGVNESLERYAALAEGVHGAAPAPWQIAALAVAGWTRLWRGERAAAQAVLARAEALHQQFGGIRALGERIGQFRGGLLAALGDIEAAAEQTQKHIDGFQTPEMASHAATWLRGYRHAHARMLWMGGDVDRWRALVPHLVAPRGAAEWPFVDVAADLVRGQARLLDGDPAGAIAPLERAVHGYARHRVPQIFADPRVTLAYARLATGDRDGAWATFGAVFDEATQTHAYGLLLLDRRAHVEALLAAAPARLRESPAYAQVRRVLEDWPASVRGAAAPGAARGTPAPQPHLASAPVRAGARDGSAPVAAGGPVGTSGPATPAAVGEPRSARAPNSGPLAALTDRELEVLARLASGTSNKQIARDFDLSLHTVKRHVANILDKLDCASRGQAADLYRRHEPVAR